MLSERRNTVKQRILIYLFIYLFNGLIYLFNGAIQYISLFLKCKKLADGVQKFGVHDEFKVIEDNATKNKSGRTFWEGRSSGYAKVTKLNPDWLSLTIRFKILQVLSQEGGDGWAHAHWNIHGFLFDELIRNVNVGETFWSPEFVGVGCEWQLQCQPIGHGQSSPDQIKVTLKCFKADSKWSTSAKWIKYRLDVANGSAMYENKLEVKAESKHDQLMKFDPNWKSLSIKARIIPLPSHQEYIEFTSIELLSGATKVFTMHGEEWQLKLSQNQMTLYTKRKRKMQQHSTQNIYTKIECKDIGVNVERLVECKYDEDWRKQLKVNSKVSYRGMISWNTYQIVEFLSFDRVKALYRGLTGNSYEILSIYDDARIQPHEKEKMDSKEKEDHVLPSKYKRIGDAVSYDVSNVNDDRSITVRCTILMMSEDHQYLYGAARQPLLSQISDKNRQIAEVSDVLNEQNKKIQEMEQEIERLSAERDSLQAATVDFRLIVSQKDEEQQRIPIAVKTPPVLNVDKDNELYTKHISIIKKWNETTQKLQSCERPSADIAELADGDDEKKECNDSSKLLEQYTVGRNLIHTQQGRLDQTNTDEHLTQLIQHQNRLNADIERLESEILSAENNAEHKEYDQAKQQRLRLTTDMKQIMAKCIETIHVENKLSTECQATAARTDELKKKLRALKTPSNRCASSIEDYNTFVASNKQYIKQTNDKFSALWSDFELKWKQWTAKDIVVWFQYKLMTKNNPQYLNWDSIEQQILSRKISGEYLPKFNDLTFKLVGIGDEEIVTYLTAQIAILVHRGNDKVPAEYLCPITKEMMKDPVLAFDGHSYERSAIEEYLKEHNKSPKTGAVADYVVVFPNHKVRADITQFLQQRQAENMVKPEAAETDYI